MLVFSLIFFVIFTSLAKHDDGISFGDALDHTLGESDAARDHLERLVWLQGARALEAPETADDSFVAQGQVKQRGTFQRWRAWRDSDPRRTRAELRDPSVHSLGCKINIFFFFSVSQTHRREDTS